MSHHTQTSPVITAPTAAIPIAIARRIGESNVHIAVSTPLKVQVAPAAKSFEIPNAVRTHESVNAPVANAHIIPVRPRIAVPKMMIFHCVLVSHSQILTTTESNQC